MDQEFYNRLVHAHRQAQADLLAERTPSGHWVGELATSALATATAVSAISLYRNALAGRSTAELDKLVQGGIHWLAEHANSDGGFGDTDKSHSNISTTWLVIAAIHLAKIQDIHVDLLAKANAYVERQGRIDGLRRRYGKDKTFAVPILTNAALAGLVPWSEVSALPFELACLPQSWYRLARLPVVSYAIPALVAVGQAKYFRDPPRNPVMRWLRQASVNRSLKVLQAMQPTSGGYLEAVPLTSFVVMSLAAIGRADHPVVQSGIKFLIQSVRSDGSWPIDTNLATWNTTLSINALAQGDFDITTLGKSVLDWVLNCQYQTIHPFTGAAPGGWGWSDLSGSVPDADDTPGAILALCAWSRSPDFDEATRHRIQQSVDLGVDWLLNLQNRDGGWPTFCRGWGQLPFDRSGADLTGHVLRAFQAWNSLGGKKANEPLLSGRRERKHLIQRAVARGVKYLERQQQSDGCWLPLWFGNQDRTNDENPVYGTAKVLLALHALGKSDQQAAIQGLKWLCRNQNDDGGWGSCAPNDAMDRGLPILSSVEETALAVEALSLVANTPEVEARRHQGLDWLIRSVETRRHFVTAPIGFYFAKLWYYERLYPLEFTVSALGRALAKPILPEQPATETNRTSGSPA